ncbi:uncharacterized protein [Nicotiana tomentosiformis]|uniref:uncharacterized protein n=1 Tax=Nicotiana tomentosiformis TaxID=4098 RepID=UPI00388C3FEF
MPKKATTTQKGKSMNDETTSRAPRVTRGENALPAIWQEFTEAFLCNYLPPELRRVRFDRFLTLRQGNMSVREYILQFDSLSRYAPTIVAKMEDRVHRFVMGLEPHLLNDCMSVSLYPGTDISHIQAYAQGVEERKQKRRADHEYDRVQSKRVRSSGPSGHVMRDCPTRGGASIVQPARSVASSSSSVCLLGQGLQAPAGHGRGKSGASSSSDPQNCIYALTGRQDHESSLDVVTCILSVSSYDVYALIDPARRVYKDHIVVVHSLSTVADLIELDMVEFDVIMGMDWLASCYANVDYRSKMVRLQFPREPILEWKDDILVYSRSEVEHVDHLRIVLRDLQESLT